YVFRYGGEEFMVLLTQTDISGAEIAAETIRKLCEAKEYSFNDHTLKITVSVGIASIKCLTKKSEDLSAFADKALYKAKADGRNCVKIYQN
ncbi:MAG: GGDEF domain-containing protein, partial [Thermodesulfobacteriota bacterium]|nr:GGDEF domain-containing protein [Thermodesulfobacteriota bacterium]